MARVTSWLRERVGADTLVLIIAFAFLVWANYATRLWSDDLCLIHTPGITDALTVAYQDYFAWTGRFFSITAVVFLISASNVWGKLPFDVLNAAVFVAMVVLMWRLCSIATQAIQPSPATRNGRAVELAFLFLAAWWLPRTIGEIALWKTGSVTYLWPMTGELFVVYRALTHRTPRSPIWLMASAFVAATCLEPLSVLVSAMLVAWSWWCWRNAQATMAGLTASHAAGTIFLIAAPGNFARAATLPASSILDRLEGVIGNLGSLLDAYWLPLIALIIISQLQWRAGRLSWQAAPGGLAEWLRAGSGWIFPALALAFMCLLIGAPRASLAARVSFPASILLACYITALFRCRAISALGERVLAVCLVSLFATHVALTAPDTLLIRQTLDSWTADSQFRDGPNTAVTLPIVKFKGRTLFVRKHVHFVGFTSDPTYFVNACYAALARVASVTAR